MRLELVSLLQVLCVNSEYVVPFFYILASLFFLYLGSSSSELPTEELLCRFFEVTFAVVVVVDVDDDHATATVVVVFVGAVVL